MVKQKFLELLSWEKNLSGVKSNPVSPMASSHNVSLHSGWGLSIYYVKCVKKEKNIKDKESRRKIMKGIHYHRKTLSTREVNLLTMISGRREPSTSMFSSWSQEIRKGRSRGEEPSEPVPKLPK